MNTKTIVVALALLSGVVISGQVVTRPAVIGVPSGGGLPNLVAVDANTIAQRNGTAAQAWRWTRTYTDDNNLKELRLAWDAGISGWLLKDFNVAAGVDSSTGTRIDIGAKTVRLFDLDNANAFSVSNGGALLEKTILFSWTVDASPRVVYQMPGRGQQCWVETFRSFPVDQTPTLCIGQGAVQGVLKLANSTDPTTASGTWQAGDNGTKPTCDSAARGMYWHDFGGAGVKDTIEICAKDAGDAYAWRTVY